MSASRNLRPGRGTTQKVRQFFSENPTEELTFEDFCAKFDCELITARAIVASLRESGTVETMHLIRAKPPEKNVRRRYVG